MIKNSEGQLIMVNNLFMIFLPSAKIASCRKWAKTCFGEFGQATNEPNTTTSVTPQDKKEMGCQ